MSRQRLLWLGSLMACAAAVSPLRAGEGGPGPKAEYALLVFGAETRLEVLVALEGEAVYLDRDGDGAFTGKGERFAKVADCKEVPLADPDGKTKYLITRISAYQDKEHKRHCLLVNVDIKGPYPYQQYCDVELVRDRKKVYAAHFHGPLSAGPVTVLWKVPPYVVLRQGEKPANLQVLIGTMDAEKGCWVVVRTHGPKQKSAFPAGVAPQVEVVFPPAREGTPAVTKRYTLDQFC